MSNEYIPTTTHVRSTYVHAVRSIARTGLTLARDEFDQWLSGVRADAKAEALEDFAKVIDSEERDQWIAAGIYRPGAQIVAGRMKVLARVARNRAAQLKETK